MKVDTPHIDKHALAGLLGEAHRLGITRLSFLPVGEEGYSYLAETTHGARYFVKAYDASDEGYAARLGQAFQITAWLRDARGHATVVAPSAMENGALSLRYRGYVVVLFDYVDGVTAMDVRPTDADWQAMATSLAAVHESADALPRLYPSEMTRSTSLTRRRCCAYSTEPGIGLPQARLLSGRR